MIITNWEDLLQIKISILLEVSEEVMKNNAAQIVKIFTKSWSFLAAQ